MDGDALPEALAALARTRERAMAEIADIETTRPDSPGSAPADSNREAAKKGAQESDDRVAFR
jgi:hypothetical protein